MIRTVLRADTRTVPHDLPAATAGGATTKTAATATSNPHLHRTPDIRTRL
jgi:hypothetical protein